jgi:uncharacterized protein
VKTAIETGDPVLLSDLLAKDPDLASQMIQWGAAGKNSAHPLHYVSDMLFDGTLAHGKEIALIDVLLKAGADCNHQASNGETPLIGAASLAAEDVGLRLLECGAQPDLTGGFQETALHWASHLGLRALAARLIEKGADVNRKDGRYHSSPLGWAIHGRFSGSPGSQGNHHEVAAMLVARGARVESEWLADERVRADAKMFSALRG